MTSFRLFVVCQVSRHMDNTKAHDKTTTRGNMWAMLWASGTMLRSFHEDILLCGGCFVEQAFTLVSIDAMLAIGMFKSTIG